LFSLLSHPKPPACHSGAALEATGDAIADAVEESEQQSGFWLVRMFQQLVQLARQ